MKSSLKLKLPIIPFVISRHAIISDCASNISRIKRWSLTLEYYLIIAYIFPFIEFIQLVNGSRFREQPRDVRRMIRTNPNQSLNTFQIILSSILQSAAFPYICTLYSNSMNERSDVAPFLAYKAHTTHNFSIASDEGQTQKTSA